MQELLLEIPECPTCHRPNLHPTSHHVVPRSRGGKGKTVRICRDCHKAVHVTFTNKELERTYNTVEALMSHPKFAKMMAFIAKQDPSRKVRMPKIKKNGRAQLDR